MLPRLFRVILPVDDIARADAFWSPLLELPVDPVVPTRHYLTTGGAILALVDPMAQYGRPVQPMPDWLYIRVPDLEATFERAQALGAGAHGAGEEAGIAQRPWGERSFYVRDPFGNPICFVDDASRDDAYGGHPGPNIFKAILPTRDLAEADRFFSELLEMDVDARVANRHFLNCTSCILALVDPVEHDRLHGNAPVEFRPNPEIVYLAVDDLDAVHDRARKVGLRTSLDEGEGIERRPWGERSFYGLDPSGNPLCFVDDQTLFTGSR